MRVVCTDPAIFNTLPCALLEQAEQLSRQPAPIWLKSLPPFVLFMYKQLEMRIEEMKQSQLSEMRGLLLGLTSTKDLPDIPQKVLDIKSKKSRHSRSQRSRA